MKNLLALIFCLVLCVGVFAGCGGDDTADNQSSGSVVSVSTDKVNFLDADGASVYRVVRSEDDDKGKEVAQFLVKEMKGVLGVNIRGCLDSEDGTDTYEILIGDVNRPEIANAKEMLIQKTGSRYNDYIICTIGKKIIIYSENPEVLMSAGDYFVKNILKKDGVEGGIMYTFAMSGDFKAVTINGNDISKYSFIRPHYNSSYLTELEMEEISAEIIKITGHDVPIKHDTYTNPGEYEIIVGNTSREGVSSISDYDAFSVEVSGKKVYINGGSAHATAVAVSEFGKKLLTGTVSDADSFSGSYQQVISTYDLATEFTKTWGDDFDGDKIDTRKWYITGPGDEVSPGVGGKPSVRSDDPNDVYVSGSCLYICAREDDEYYYGGKLRSLYAMNYKYGYLESSMKIPQGVGFWSGLWTGSNDSVSSLGPGAPILTKPEIDIMECFGNSSYYAANCHAWPSPEAEAMGYEHTSLDIEPYASLKQYKSVDEGKRLGDDFHTYGFLWDNTKMAFSCDGDLFFSYDTTTTDSDREAFNYNMNLIISLATAFASGPEAKITDDPIEWAETNKLIVDWVNIYQRQDGMSNMIIT